MLFLLSHDHAVTELLDENNFLRHDIQCNSLLFGRLGLSLGLPGNDNNRAGQACHAKEASHCNAWSQNLVSLTSMAVPFYGITAGNNFSLPQFMLH